jgi:CelD/BcsL family acetyltransferase involved in cellulose biosynthesis
MDFTVVGARDRALWAAGISASGANDVYYLLDYHQLYGFRGGQCFAYIARDGGETLFHPFILRPVGQIGSIHVSARLNDIETVYGYTGPVATTDAPDFLGEAWRGFDAWCLENGVVAEFTRFHPLLRTERFAAPQAEIRLDRETVTVRLDGNEEQLWKSYSSTQRNRLRKALSLGLTCRQVDLHEHLSAFVRLYEATMQRCNAATFYYFPQSYYDLIRRTLAADTKLFLVEYREKVVAGGIFFAAGNTVHYHLGGSCAEAQQFAPNNLLFHQVAVWAQRHGFAVLHLGGGRSNAPDDPLLRFKRGFSPDSVSFHVGRLIHDQGQYDQLCELWMNQYGQSMSPSYFPPYRARGDHHLPREHAA